MTNGHIKSSVVGPFDRPYRRAISYCWTEITSYSFFGVCCGAKPVRLSQAVITLYIKIDKRRMITQTTPRRSLGTIKPRHYFSDAKDFGEIQRELLQQGRKMQVGLVKIGDF